MTDDEKIAAVTAKLLEGFCLGQRVRIVGSQTSTFEGRQGVIREIKSFHYGVELPELYKGEILYFLKTTIQPL